MVVSPFRKKVAELDKQVDLRKKNARRKKCKIYLFRHAQTFYNKKHIFTGHKDSKLTPFGRKQARKVARLLKEKKIDVAVHSRLSRSKDTLSAVLSFHPECLLKVEDDRMIERSYGVFEGKSHRWFVGMAKELLDDAATWHYLEGYHHEHKVFHSLAEKELHFLRRNYVVCPSGGESVKDVEKRVKRFISDLLYVMRTYKVHVAISAHGNSMRPFRRYFEKLSVDQMMQLENPWDDYFEYEIEV